MRHSDYICFVLVWLPLLYSNLAIIANGFKLEKDLRKHFDIYKDLKYDFLKLLQVNNLWRKKLGLPKLLHEIGDLGALEHGKPADVDERCELYQSNDTALKYQGDIILSPKQLNTVLRAAGQRRRFKRKVIKNPAYHWKSTTIHYTMDEELDPKATEAIKGAIQHWEAETCLRFKKGTAENYLHFFPGQGCYSSVGVVGQRQGISVGLGCETMGIVAHEIGHAIGFWHEQSRPDRDDFITIRYGNMMPQAEGNFLKNTWQDTTNGGELYDLGSIMHYGPTAFTDNGENTIDTNDPVYQNTIGQRKGLSFIDVKQANQLYCKDSCKNSKVQCNHEGYRDPNKCSRCKCPVGVGGRTCNQPGKSDKSCKSRSLIGGKTKKTLASGRISKPDMYCNWLVKCKRGKARVQLVKTDFFCRGTCYDFVEIKASNFSQTGARFCCSPPPEPIMAKGPVISISMQTTEDATTGFNGFELQYWCEGDEPGITEPKRRKPTPSPARNGIWKKWSLWEPCSATCGYCGNQRRYRTCASGNGKCAGKSAEVRQCAPTICPDDNTIGGGSGISVRETCMKAFDTYCSYVPYLEKMYQKVKVTRRKRKRRGRRRNGFEGRGDGRGFHEWWRYRYRHPKQPKAGKRGRNSNAAAIRHRSPRQRGGSRSQRQRGGRRSRFQGRGSGEDRSICKVQVTGKCNGFLKSIRNNAGVMESTQQMMQFKSYERRKNRLRNGKRQRGQRWRQRHPATGRKQCCRGVPSSSGICLRRR